MVYGCHAACVSKPQSTAVFRSTFLRSHYQKYAAQCLSVYGLTKGLGGNHNIVWSWEILTAIYESAECLDSPNGFSPGDIFRKINGRIAMEDVVDISDFLM